MQQFDKFSRFSAFRDFYLFNRAKQLYYKIKQNESFVVIFKKNSLEK